MAAGYHEVVYDDGDTYKGDWNAEGKVRELEPSRANSTSSGNNTTRKKGRRHDVLGQGQGAESFSAPCWPRPRHLGMAELTWGEPCVEDQPVSRPTPFLAPSDLVRSDRDLCAFVA